VRTWTIGAYASQGFGDAYVAGMVAYGFSRFDVSRTLSLLSRRLDSNFRGTQFDASLEGGYNFSIGDDIVATPFAALAVRNWSMNEASEAEQGSGGVAVVVDEASKSIFKPVVGGRIAARFETASNFVLMPYAKLSYTFQGDIGSDRTFRMIGGGNSFVLNGVNPGGYGAVEVGVDSVVNDRINLFLGGAYSFAGGNNIANVRGGIGFAF
jgi:outer membrane autotransporter protein